MASSIWLPPNAVVDQRSLLWRSRWGRDRSQAPVSLVVLAKVRQMALESWAPEPLEPVELARAMSTLPDRTALGLDFWQPAAWKVAPPAALAELRALLHQISCQVCWPAQVLCQMVRLLVKPSLDDRPISLMPMLARLWARLHRSTFQAWSKGWAGEWDKAVAGSSALRAMIQSLIVQETWAELGHGVAEICWDIEKFYDDVAIASLAVSAIKRGYPPRQLALALLLYLGPRVLVQGQAAAPFADIFNSIIQGCSQANNMARLVMYDVLQFICWHKCFIVLRQYVDDLQEMAPYDPEDPSDPALIELEDSAVTLIRDIKGSGHIVSPKSTVFATTHRVALALRDAIARRTGLRLAISDCVRDLGFDNSAMRRRRLTTAIKRVGKSKLRHARILRIRKFSPAASEVLAASGFVPQAMFHGLALGLSDTNLQAIRSAFAQSSALYAPRRCTTTIIALVFGQHRDPAVVMAKSLVAEWLQFWAQCDQKSQVMRAWVLMYRRFTDLKPELHWGKVRGTMSAVIVLLLRLSWQPSYPNAWVDSRGDLWQTFNGTADASQLLSQVQADVLAALWATTTSNHPEGLAGGCDMASLPKLIQKFKSLGKLSLSGVIATAAADGIWTRDVLFKAGYLVNPLCPRCEQEPETLEHRYWGCSCNREVQDPVVSASDYLRDRAHREILEGQCAFWLRGLIPSAWTALAEPSRVVVVEVGEAIDQQGPLQLDFLFIDGSGDTNDPRLRRCGWSCVWISAASPPVLRGAVYGCLGDEAHTTPRAELVALRAALQRSAGPVVIVSDCEYVVKRS